MATSDRLTHNIRVQPNGCWVWTGAKDTCGYGVVRHQGRQRQAHRVQYERYYHQSTEGMCVLHSCDTPACVNPVHLRLGTQRENMAEKVAKGRQAAGESHGSAKLTNEVIREMRRLWTAGEHTQQQIADAYGVSRANVARIVNHRSWRMTA